ncbi:hypothetical protein NEOKW01_0968 [Nematocida sp. AWRm80]|nr:hypothetical protein NEOKW01_0968 [Nematocida sp. AWRm80]
MIDTIRTANTIFKLDEIKDIPCTRETAIHILIEQISNSITEISTTDSNLGYLASHWSGIICTLPKEYFSNVIDLMTKENVSNTSLLEAFSILEENIKTKVNNYLAVYKEMKYLDSLKLKYTKEKEDINYPEEYFSLGLQVYLKESIKVYLNPSKASKRTKLEDTNTEIYPNTIQNCFNKISQLSIPDVIDVIKRKDKLSNISDISVIDIDIDTNMMEDLIKVVLSDVYVKETIENRAKMLNNLFKPLYLDKNSKKVTFNDDVKKHIIPYKKKPNKKREVIVAYVLLIVFIGILFILLGIIIKKQLYPIEYIGNS